jgi:O-acetyl-ADP-ribose deacetylase (regulator of RNase III)
MVSARRPAAFRLLLIGELELVEAWQAEFAGWGDSVDAYEGRFEDRIGDFDALVSPGNSYGQMNGGIDGAISTTFPRVQKAVWNIIAERHHGYQPVGTAEVVETSDERCPYLVHAPTMRIPMRLAGDLDIAVHDAMWAALLALERHDAHVSTLACPGLGTGYGSVPPDRAAQLMAAAYRMWRADADTPISDRESALER